MEWWNLAHSSSMRGVCDLLWGLERGAAERGVDVCALAALNLGGEDTLCSIDRGAPGPAGEMKKSPFSRVVSRVRLCAAVFPSLSGRTLCVLLGGNPLEFPAMRS